MKDTTPPNAIDAERALLGAIILDHGAFWDVAGFLQPDDFYLVKHRWIFEAMAHLANLRQPVDSMTVAGELDRRGKLKEVGGYLGVSQLSDGVPTALHAEAYGRTVEEAAVRRRLLSAASGVARLAYDEKAPIDSVIEQSERQLFEVSERRAVGALRPVRETTSEVFDRVQALAEDERGVIGLPTGYADLDNLLGGLGTDCYHIVAGRPGMGKTSFLLGILAHIAGLEDAAGQVAMFSLEMSRQQLVMRLAAGRSKIDSNRLRRGQLTPDEWERFGAAMAWASELPLYIDDTAGVTPSQVRSRCRRLYAEKRLRLVVLDYIQLMSTSERSENRNQEVTYISGQLVALARELQVPVIAAAQLSRGPEARADKRPQLSDLRESGSLEQDADSVILLYRDEYYTKERSEQPGVAEVDLAKYRHGPTGKVDMYWQGNTMQFLPLQK